jgi:Domain of unknown function (DUF1963)
MLGKLFGRGHERTIPGDHFGLGALCDRHNLGHKALKIVKSSRNAVEIRLTEFNCQLAHIASRVGGHPALPDDVDWPISNDGAPMIFLAQFSCGELSTERYEGLPDEGIISVFLDTMDSEPSEARVFHYSLTRDMRRRAPPNAPATEKMAYRPTFHAIITIPRPDSSAYSDLELDEEEKSNYTRLLDELDQCLDASALQLGGHPPYRLEREDVPGVDDGNWEFFLAVHDIEELFVSWPEGGCAFVWIPPLDTRFRRGRAALTWQVLEDEDWDAEWDDEDDDDEEA